MAFNKEDYKIHNLVDDSHEYDDFSNPEHDIHDLLDSCKTREDVIRLVRREIKANPSKYTKSPEIKLSRSEIEDKCAEYIREMFVCSEEPILVDISLYDIWLFIKK